MPCMYAVIEMREREREREKERLVEEERERQRLAEEERKRNIQRKKETLLLAVSALGFEVKMTSMGNNKTAIIGTK